MFFIFSNSFIFIRVIKFFLTFKTFGSSTIMLDISITIWPLCDCRFSSEKVCYKKCLTKCKNPESLKVSKGTYHRLISSISVCKTCDKTVHGCYNCITINKAFQHNEYKKRSVRYGTKNDKISSICTHNYTRSLVTSRRMGPSTLKCSG